MKRISGLFLALWAVATSGQVSPVYENWGAVTAAPQIDATVFINHGLFDFTGGYGTNGLTPFIYTAGVPFDTQDTLYYTNLASGTMANSSGFNFQFIGNNGTTGPAQAVVNLGNIQGIYLNGLANTIVNSGLLNADGGGLIRLTADKINLTRGGLTAYGLGNFASPFANTDGTAMIWYGQGVNNHVDDKGKPLSLSGLTLDVPSPVSPFHQAIQPTFGGALGSLLMTNLVTVPYLLPSGSFAAFAQTNQVDPTNLLIQVMFVNTNVYDTNLIITAGFAPYPGDQPGSAAVVVFKAFDFDIVRGVPITNYFTFADISLTQTNHAYATNFYGDLLRPDGYLVRLGPRPLFTKLGTNTAFTNTLLSSSTYSNTTATNYYLAYSAQVGVTPSAATGGSALMNPALADPTNFPGRIEVRANVLDLTKARIKAQSVIALISSNLVSNTGLQVDAPYLDYDLTFTNQSFLISNTIPKIANRLTGDIWAWTGLWSNTTSSVTTDASGNSTTNTVNIAFQALVFDHLFFGSIPVQMYDLTLRGNHVEMADDVLIANSLLLDVNSLHVKGLFYGPGLTYFNYTNAPRLLSFTNDGQISIYGGATFGNDRPVPYDNFVNTGKLSSDALKFSAKTFINSGTNLAASGTLLLRAQQAKLDNGLMQAGADIDLGAEDLKVFNARLTAAAILLNVTNRLSDGGASTNNKALWQCTNGFKLFLKPPLGDLMGTTITSKVAQFMVANHVWAGEDRGPIAAGFTNNVAIGKLVLDGAPSSLFSFQAASQSNALYVDYLDLEHSATNFLDALDIATNLVVYFAAANLPAEQLDGQLNGRLRWVAKFAGPHSSTNVTLANGQVITVNTGLRTSKTIDSDGDGIPNAYDPTPFDGVRLVKFAVTNAPTREAVISWTAAAQTIYQVQYATNLVQANWQLLMSYTNSVTTNRLVSVNDQVPAGPTQRFYRVGYTP